jgi:hypothetical protein
VDGWTITGTLASIAGLGVGVWTLKVASGAREAAKAAARKARERDLVEELEEAHGKAQQVGLLLINSEWNGAYLRAADVQTASNSVAVRWADAISLDRRNDLLTAAELARSIANTAQELRMRPDQPRKQQAAGDTQLRTAQLIAGALAEARMRMERGTDNAHQ